MGTPKRSGDSAVLPNAHSALIDPKVNEFNSFDQFKASLLNKPVNFSISWQD